MNTRRAIFSAVFCAGLGLLACVGAGEALSRPASHPVGDPPPGLNALAVVFSTADREPVSGWFIRGTAHRGAVLLLHGVRSDRRAMVERARLLGQAGYSVLLIDLPAHGESGGARITFGLREGAGVRAALGFLRRQLPGEPVGVIGVSLGAASLVLSKATPPPDAVVLESMYPTIAEAVADRLMLRLGPAGRAMAPLLLWQLPVRLGLTADELRPIAEMPSLRAPVLVMAGTLDQHTTLAESRRIFEAAAEPKEFWAVEGAAHVDLFAHSPQAYASRVLPFLANHLHQPTNPR